MSRKPNNYSEFLQFAHEHESLTRKQVFKQFKQNGGKISERKAYEILNKEYNIDKVSGKRQPINKSKKPVKNDKPKQTRNNYYKLDLKKNRECYDIHSPAVRKLHENIKDMYGTEATKFLRIRVMLANDPYTQEQFFNVMIPFLDYRDKGTKNIGVKTLGYAILDNLETFYKNLYKRYKTETFDIRNPVEETLSDIRSWLNHSKSVSWDKLKQNFEDLQLEIGDPKIIQFTEN